MPPKKKKPVNSESTIEITEDTVLDEKANMASLPSGLEDLLDSRLKLQLAQINDLFLKFTDTTKSELESRRQSQEFLSIKFDELVASTNQLKNENKELRIANTQLQERVVSLEKQHISLDTETENMKRYLRRDLLEIHGVPESSTENTNKLVVQVANLIVPELNLIEADISISHRLPTNKESLKPIIAKFVRRDIRDAIYKKKRNLSSKTSQDIGFHYNSKLYINESLTAGSRAILNKAKEFKRRNHYKFVWTRQGKVLLKKDEDRSETHIFATMKEFEEFNNKFICQLNGGSGFR
jgi:hypothetical protein